MLCVSEYVNTGYLKNYPPPQPCKSFPMHTEKTEMIDDNSQYNGIKVNFLLFSVIIYFTSSNMDIIHVTRCSEKYYKIIYRYMYNVYMIYALI